MKVCQSYDRSIKTSKKKSIPIHKIRSIRSVILHENVAISSLNRDKILFAYCASIKALLAFQNGDYQKFDSLTTTTCCHGMSVLVYETLNEISDIDINLIIEDLEIRRKSIETDFRIADSWSIRDYCLPQSIIFLTQLYILSVIKEEDHYRGGWRTVVQNLKDISPIGTKFCGELVKQLQLKFSNMIAEKYGEYLRDLDEGLHINKTPTKLWGKYVQNDFIRQDRRGRRYVACMFSMQIVLSYIIQNGIKIAFVSDLKCRRGEFRDRYTKLLEGRKCSKFYESDTDEVVSSNPREPVIVFGGCTHSNDLDVSAFESTIRPWLHDFPSLILACDTFYPQFPKVKDDPDFDSTPIVPSELRLMNVIDLHQKVDGVSAQDPSLFCLTHVYVSSIEQVRKSIEGEFNGLFYSFVPECKTSNKEATRAVKA